MTPLDRLRDYLLPASLEYAARNSPFYERHLGDAWRDVRTVAELTRLPALTKAVALANEDAMRCGPPVLDLGAVSSGTTRVGTGYLRVQHSPEEQAATAEFLAQIRGPSWRREGLVLHVLSPYHGIPSGAGDVLRLAWAADPAVCALIRDALERSYDGERITVLRISASALQQLTVWLLEQGADFGRFALRTIGTNAALVTRRWRGVLETTWGARILDNYSLSELVTAATECDACGWYHLGAPPLAIEVVDPTTGAQLSSGVGHLLATTLYPYVQRQPFVRYATGDLVELGPGCARANDLSLRFRGRLHQTVLRGSPGGTEYLLFPTELQDLADDFADIARHPVPLERAGAIAPQSAGQPLVHAAADPSRVRVRFGVRFAPALFPDRAASLSAALAAGLRARHPALDAACSKGLALHIDLDRGDAGPWFVKYTT